MSTEENVNSPQKSKAITVKKKNASSADFSVTAVRKRVTVSDEINETRRRKPSPPEWKDPSDWSGIEFEDTELTVPSLQEETAKPLRRKKPSEEPKEEDTQKPLRRKITPAEEAPKPVRRKRPVTDEEDAVKPVRKKRPVVEEDDEEEIPVRRSAPVQEHPKKTRFRLKKSAKAGLAAIFVAAVCCVVVVVRNSSRQNVEEINNKHMTTAEAAGTYSEMETLAMPTTEAPVTETETETETLPPATMNPNFEDADLFIDYNYPVAPTKPMIALTFDDGPAEGSTDDILDVLEEYNAHATFFVVGNNITDSTKRLIQREYALGCEIANHTKEHLSLRDELDLEGGMEALEAVDKKVYNCIGRNTAHIRPPYGAYTEAILEACGKSFIYWSLDSNDWKWKDAQKDYDTVMENVSDGDIILMHDIHQPTADAIKRIVPDLIAEGYQLVTVSELMYYRNFTLDKGVVLYNLHPNEPLYDSLYGEEVTDYNPNGIRVQQYEPAEDNYNYDENYYYDDYDDYDYNDDAEAYDEEDTDVVSDAEPEMPNNQNAPVVYDNTAPDGGFIPDENLYPDVTAPEAEAEDVYQ